MTSAELLQYLNINGITVELRDGRLLVSPKEKAAAIATELSAHAKFLARRAKGSYRDWQGHTRRLRDGCERRYCATCEGWNPEFDDDGKLTGLCVSKIASSISLK